MNAVSANAARFVTDASSFVNARVSASLASESDGSRLAASARSASARLDASAPACALVTRVAASRQSSRFASRARSDQNAAAARSRLCCCGVSDAFCTASTSPLVSPTNACSTASSS